MKKEDSPAVRILIALALTAYFIYFAHGALRAHFASDDMMNIGRSLDRGALLDIRDNITFWSNAYRPFGALLYLVMFRMFELDPLPYRILLLILMAANLYLTYAVAQLVTKSWAAAFLIAVLAGANYEMVALYYSTSQIYDVLAYSFTLLLLFGYIRIRSGGSIPSIAQSIVLMCVYIAALNSKEIAVVAAGWILAYEFLMFDRPAWRFPVVLTAVGLIYTAGKMWGPDSLSHVPGYTMEFTIHRFIVNNTRYLNQLLYSTWFDSGRKLLIAWLISAALCAILRNRRLWWAWFLVSTATLPVWFVEMARDGASLYLPLFAWAMLAGVFVITVIEKPRLRWLIVILLAIGSVQVTRSQWNERARITMSDQEVTWSVLTQLRDLGKRPPSNAKVIMLTNPFPDYDALFIAKLVWDDPTVEIKLANHMPAPPTPAEIDSFDWVLAFDDTKLRVVRAR